MAPSPSSPVGAETTGESLRVLLTGANGFIGRHVLENLGREFDMRVLVRSAGVFADGVDIIRYSDPSESAVDEAVRGVDVIVHAAALLHGSREEMWKANVELTERLLSLATTYGVGHFIYLSSENVGQGQVDLYSASKRAAEAKVTKFPLHTILRPTVVYGSGDTKYVTRLARMVQRLPLVPMLGMGRNRFQFLFVEDLVAVILSTILKPIPGVYVIAGIDNVSYREFMQTLMRALGRKRPVLPLPLFMLKPIAWILDLVMSNPPITPGQLANLGNDRCYEMAQTCELFGYVPTSLEDGLKALVAEEFAG